MSPGIDVEPSDRARHARRLFAGIAEGYDRMGAVLSYGRDRAWRRFLVSRVPPGARVLDVATGTGLVARDLRARRCRVVGLDASPQMLAFARGPRVLGLAERLPFADASFDALTFTYLLRYVDDPAATLAELARVVRPGGVMASLEFGLPRSRILRAGWRLQTRWVLPALGRLASPAWREAGVFLGPSIEAYRRAWPPEREAEAWRAAGMQGVRFRERSLGAGVVMWGVRE